MYVANLQEHEYNKIDTYVQDWSYCRIHAERLRLNISVWEIGLDIHMGEIIEVELLWWKRN